MTLINLIFENATKFYFEGEIIRLKLEIELEESSTMNSITANLVGFSSVVCAEEKDSVTSSSKTRPKTSREVYFDDFLPIFVADDKEAAVWPSGVQVFMFAYQLPQKLPASVEGSFGFVRYSVNVLADVDGKTVKKTEHFTLLTKNDLDADSSSFLPGVVWQPENQCIFQALFCSGTNTRAFLHIAKVGYVPGEYIYVNAEVSNLYRRPIEWVKASLVQILTYRHSNSLKEKRVVSEVTRGSILPRDSQTWRSESLLVPAIPPTTYRPKRLISVKYKLMFQYKPSWERNPVALKQKIIIGTVKSSECVKGLSEGEASYSSHLFDSSNLEPCIFGPRSIDDGDDNISLFVPVYPICKEV